MHVVAGIVLHKELIPSALIINYYSADKPHHASLYSASSTVVDCRESITIFQERKLTIMTLTKLFQRLFCLWVLSRTQVSAFSTEARQEPVAALNPHSRSPPIYKPPTLSEAEKPKTQEASYHEAANAIASSFDPIPFHTAITSRHLQTILALFLRTEKEFCYIPVEEELFPYMFGRAGSLLSALARPVSDVRNGAFWDHRQRVDTPDGDFFHVDYKYHCFSRYLSSPSSRGLVVVVHGLQTSSNSTSSIDMARAFCNQGFDVACINFRGCSGVPNNRLAAYHLGFTEDLKYFLQLLNSKQTGFADDLPIFLSGFSLGANVVLKCLGELGSRAHSEFNIFGAAVCCAPLDIERNSGFMQAPGFNRNVYNNFLLDSLKETTLAQLDRLEENTETQKINRDEVAAAETVTDFDNAVICPLFGFKDHTDYYRKCSSQNFLDKIRVPTFILNSRDDPFFILISSHWRRVAMSMQRAASS